MKFLVLVASHLAKGGQLELDASNYLTLEARVNALIRHPVSDDAYEKMSQSLYLLIQRTGEQIDAKENECHEEQHATTERIETLQSDLSALWADVARTRTAMADAQGQMRASRESVSSLEMARRDLEAECHQKVKDDEAELETLNKHVLFMHAVKRSVECPKSKKPSFLQTTIRTTVKHCTDGSITISSPVGDATNSVVTSSRKRNIPGVDPLYGGKVKTKCTLSKMNCSKAYDLAHALTGEVEDSKKELEAAMLKESRACDKRLTTNNASVRDMTHTIDLAQIQLATATSELAGREAQSDKKEQEMRLEEKELRASQKDCKAKLEEMRYSDLCIYKSLRKKLADAKGKPLPQDCEVGEWVSGGCSRSCGGGVEKLTREVVLPSTGSGVACPALLWKRSCSPKPCPEQCEVAEWTGWSSCTADCGGGVQSRSRELLKKSRYGPAQCSTTQTRVCNTSSCSRDCTLHRWTKWSACTRACGGGMQRKKRRVKKPAYGDGKCPNKYNKQRLRTRACNPEPCPRFNPTCAVPYDVVIAVDSSGSWENADAFEQQAKRVAVELSTKFDRVGVVQFADMAKTLESADELQFVGGGTRIARGLIAARDRLLNAGRASVQTLIFVITDAMTTSYRFEVKKVSEDLDATGARIVLLAVYEDDGHPPLYKRTNELQELLHVDKADVLVEPASSAARAAVLATCQHVVEDASSDEAETGK